jgi:membrane dipeptidase
MGRNKRYNGYKAYQYLSPGFDFKEFKLCKEINRVSPYLVELSKNEEERLENIIENNILIDVHEHPVVSPEDMSQALTMNSLGRNFTAYEALSMSGLDCIFDHLMNGIGYITSYMGWKWSDVIHDIGMRLSDIHHQDLVIPCLRVQDIKDAFTRGQIALVFCLEAATPIENELDRLDVLYGLGIRSMGICYDRSNMLGGSTSEPNNGLTDFGYDAVKRMNKLGILIDKGHANIKTMIETIEASDKPIYFSHARPSIAVSKAAVDDYVLHALAEKGGLFGVGGAGYGMITEKHPVGSIDSYMEAIEFCIDLIGIDHVACGPDTMYGDQQALYKYWFPHPLGHYNRPGKTKTPSVRPSVSDPNPTHLTKLPDGIDDPGYVKGLENPNEFINIPRWMIKNGYSDNEIIKIIGLNALKLLEKVWC